MSWCHHVEGDSHIIIITSHVSASGWFMILHYAWDCQHIQYRKDWLSGNKLGPYPPFTVSWNWCVIHEIIIYNIFYGYRKLIPGPFIWQNSSWRTYGIAIIILLQLFNFLIIIEQMIIIWIWPLIACFEYHKKSIFIQTSPNKSFHKWMRCQQNII